VQAARCLSSRILRLGRLVLLRSRVSSMLCSSGQERRSTSKQKDGLFEAPRIQAELRAISACAVAERVARLMCRTRLHGWLRERKVRTPPRAGSFSRRPRIWSVGPSLHNSRIRLWVADINYVCTKEGILYLVFVLYAYSRRVVGWSICISIYGQRVGR
jgi:hypothetical protein